MGSPEFNQSVKSEWVPWIFNQEAVTCPPLPAHPGVTHCRLYIGTREFFTLVHICANAVNL
jgi:hypothetical protein